MELYDIDLHIEKIKEVYSARAEIMLDSIKQYFPEDISYDKPDGGLFLWVELPASVDAGKVAISCLENNVAIIPGSAFFACGTSKNTLRLNFSNTSDERIVEGMKRIGEVLHREFAQLNKIVEEGARL